MAEPKYIREAFAWRIIETDNFGGDYPDEKFLNIAPTNWAKASTIAAAINTAFCDHDYARRFWRVVDKDYVLRPGFEP